MLGLELVAVNGGPVGVVSCQIVEYLAQERIGLWNQAGRTSFVLLVQVVYILFLDLQAEKAKNVIGVVMIVIVTIVINDFGELGA